MIYAQHLARSTDYTNTWFHKEPRGDIMDRSSFYADELDFIVCSEVLEHVPQPTSTALETLHDLLRPGGLLILSVPVVDGETTEHYPPLTWFDVEKQAGNWRLTGETRDGERFVAEDPVFHGGPGSTVEMRIWGRDSLTQALMAAGFVEIREHRTEHPTFGILFGDSSPAGVWTARSAVEPSEAIQSSTVAMDRDPR